MVWEQKNLLNINTNCQVSHITFLALNFWQYDLMQLDEINQTVVILVQMVINGKNDSEMEWIKMSILIVTNKNLFNLRHPILLWFLSYYITIL